MNLIPRADPATFCETVLALVVMRFGPPVGTDQLLCFSDPCEPDAKQRLWLDSESGTTVTLTTVRETGIITGCAIGYRRL